MLAHPVRLQKAIGARPRLSRSLAIALTSVVALNVAVLCPHALVKLAEAKSEANACCFDAFETVPAANNGQCFNYGGACNLNWNPGLCSDDMHFGKNPCSGNQGTSVWVDADCFGGHPNQVCVTAAGNKPTHKFTEACDGVLNAVPLTCSCTCVKSFAMQNEGNVQVQICAAPSNFCP